PIAFQKVLQIFCHLKSQNIDLKNPVIYLSDGFLDLLPVIVVSSNLKNYSSKANFVPRLCYISRRISFALRLFLSNIMKHRGRNFIAAFLFEFSELICSRGVTYKELG